MTLTQAQRSNLRHKFHDFNFQVTWIYLEWIHKKYAASLWITWLKKKNFKKYFIIHKSLNFICEDRLSEQVIVFIWKKTPLIVIDICKSVLLAFKKKHIYIHELYDFFFNPKISIFFKILFSSNEIDLIENFQLLDLFGFNFLTSTWVTDR